MHDMLKMGISEMERDFWRKDKVRSKVEIYLSILHAIQSEQYAKPTHIMYKSNVSWIVLQLVLRSMVKNGLIGFVEKSGRKLYYLTSEGLRAIEALEEANGIIKMIEMG
jgi:predicted transcriptional regulator